MLIKLVSGLGRRHEEVKRANPDTNLFCPSSPKQSAELPSTSQWARGRAPSPELQPEGLPISEPHPAERQVIDCPGLGGAEKAALSQERRPGSLGPQCGPGPPFLQSLCPLQPPPLATNKGKEAHSSLVGMANTSCLSGWFISVPGAQLGWWPLSGHL